MMFGRRNQGRQKGDRYQEEKEKGGEWQQNL
jgi:hypothetical protein